MSNINPYIHDFTVDLRNGVTMERAKKPLSQGDAFANKIVAHVLKDGQTVPLDGVAVSASVIRYDGATVPLTGTVEEGAACIVLNDECYAVPGDLLVSVVLAVGEVKQTILRLMLNVETSQTDIIADGGVIGSFSQLLAEIENMRSATAAAISAAERAEAAADKAEGIAPGGGGTGTVTSVNGVQPDEAGNVEIDIPEPPKKLSEMEGDAEHRLVTDAEKTAWNAKSTFSGKYADLTGKPTIPTKTSQLTNDIGYLTEHQDVSHLLPKSELGAAVDTALAEAKASGAFDGEDGKSAYAYAQDGGYTGTEAAFAAKLAEPAFDPTAYDIPVLYLTGSTDGMTKDDAVTLTYACEDKDGNAKSGTCTVKWQGSSSLAYAKKNYTIKFDNAFEVVDGWTAQKKYCFKANFIDHSHARNLVSCKLWGQIVKSRAGVDSRLTALPNAGAVDGFPCVIMLNGAFHGLYTWNIPKDGWMFGMPTGSNVQQAIVCGDKYTDATYFKALAALDGTDYELEYCSTSDTSWVKTSFNRMLQAVIDSNGGNIDTVLAKYIDIDSAIDYLIDTVLVQAPDCQAKNTLYVTYDGVKWFMSAYDRDSTFGLHFAGKSFYGLDEAPTFTGWKYHRLMNLLWTYKREAIRTRYAEIRAAALSENNVAKVLWNFESGIPKALLNRDVEKWPSIPSSSVSDVHQMMEHYRLRCRLVDEWVKSTSGELDPPSGYTNLVPTSVDASGNVYNSKGYKDGYRMNSSGSEVAETGSTVTGFMACKNTDTIRVTGLPFGPAASCGVYGYVSCFDAEKNKLVSTSMDNISTSSTGGTNQGITASNPSGTWGKNNIVTLTFGGVSSTMAYLRISSSIDANAGVQTGADLIVTKNEEIT